MNTIADLAHMSHDLIWRRKLLSMVQHECVANILLAQTDFVVAGGAALHMLSAGDIARDDVDVFHVGAADSTTASASAPKTLAADILRALHAAGVTCLLRVSAFAYTIIARGLDLQIVRQSFASVDELFNNFDLPCCEVAFRPHDLQFEISERGQRAFTTRTIDCADIRTHKPLATGRRVMKYKRRGFSFVGTVPAVADASAAAFAAYYNSRATVDVNVNSDDALARALEAL